MATFSMDMPPALTSPDRDLQALRSYIARLVDRLLYTINHIDSENLVEGGVSIGKISGGRGAIAAAAVQEMSSAQQGTGDFQHLSAQVAEIVTAVIQHAVIDWANIKHLVGETAIIAKFVGEKMFIDQLAVRAAQMVQLTVGTLCIKAADGEYYTLDVDMATGTVTAHQVEDITQEELENGELTGGKQHIIETDLTVADLNASDIYAVEALIDKLTAARIDVDELTARQAFIQKIVAGEIASQLGQTLNLSSNQSIQSTVRQIAADGDNELRGDMSVIRQTMENIDLSVQRIENQGIGTHLILEEDMVRIRQAGEWEQQLTADELRFKNRTTGAVAARFGVAGGYADRLQSWQKLTVGGETGSYDMSITAQGLTDKWRTGTGQGMPIITAGPESVRTTLNGSFTLEVEAENATNELQWQSAPIGSDDWENIYGATSDTYSGTADLESIARQYRCLAGTGASEPVRVFIAGAPVITGVSLSGSTLTGTAAGATAWHWQKYGSSAWADIATTADSASTTGPGRYRLYVTNSSGPAVSGEITVE